MPQKHIEDGTERGVNQNTLYMVLFSQLHRAFCFISQMRRLYQIFSRGKTPKSFYIVLTNFVVTLRTIGKVEAIAGKGTRSDLRHDNHTVSLLTDHVVLPRNIGERCCSARGRRGRKRLSENFL